MEKENKVQLPDAAQGAEAQKEEGAVGSFGKFKSADALLNAYNSLEAEFTRRSQRLRELEGRLQDGNRMSSAAEGESRQQPQSLDEQVGAAVENTSPPGRLLTLWRTEVRRQVRLRSASVLWKRRAGSHRNFSAKTYKSNVRIAENRSKQPHQRQNFLVKRR